MESMPNTTLTSDLEHPDDGQYIWLPILVLVGVIVLAGLVYALSRSRRTLNCGYFKRRNATRYGYLSVDDGDGDSDVSMIGADEFDQPNSVASLLDARLQITPRYPQFNTDADDIA
ncbi:uncharacterized protein LOC6563428 isoform X2 [Drosophila grimshawi]|uniref:GH18987 n=1 Tax=Drosophila grimshawi TaxID=7222 RepID=B4JHU0_DROGR|nr:uncharacterized protein LOC6563428 isoform X2 [Drosophila grimshawi]EDV92848.1 GH18987 [Drosophila grimshawi]